MKIKMTRCSVEKIIKEYMLLLIGSLIIALSFNLFLNPNGIASGGVSGLSTIVEYQFGIEAAYTQWALNIPLFIAGLIILGKRFGLKTAVGSVVLPLLVYLTRDFEPLTNQLLLATIYGGVGIGIGLGLVFRGKSSTGGTDLASQIIHKYTGLSLGLSVLIMDGFVVFTAGIVFGLEKAMFALISLFIVSKTIDIVQLGLSYSKIAYIISDEQEKIGLKILNDLDRGATILNATGGYTGEPRRILMVVFPQRDITRLKETVKSVDPNA
ncbi:MAG: YitT family protein, partial [Vulcanibacillus sp.]